MCYLEILQLAADEGLGAVENVVEQLLMAPKPVVNAAEVAALPASSRAASLETPSGRLRLSPGFPTRKPATPPPGNGRSLAIVAGGQY